MSGANMILCFSVPKWYLSAKLNYTRQKKLIFSNLQNPKVWEQLSSLQLKKEKG